jgi:DNA primase
MRIPESKLAEVAAAADIVQVISSYVELRKAGKDYRGLCPFHGDKDPSFYVSPQKGIFHCFGCAVGGSVFNFVMKIENISFVEAVRVLAQRYGVSFQLEEGHRAKVEDRERFLVAVEAGQSYFRANLTSNLVAQQYLLDREISTEWIEFLGLGFAPDSWDGIHSHLRSHGINSGDALSVGLVRDRTGGGYYDYFRSRIMIPIRNLNGQIIGFGGRILGEGDPKYLNSPESGIFRKRSILYGLDSARDAIRREGYVIVVEGYFDQISLRIRGFENTVAPLGTALGVEQISLIKRFCGRALTLFDSDEAGLRALKRSIPLFLAAEMEPSCLILDQDKDPDEAIKRLGAQAFHKLLERAVPMIDYFLGYLESQYDVSTIHGRNLALEECLPILREVADSKERDYFIERLSSRIRIREDRLIRLLRDERGKRYQKTKTGSTKTLFDFPADERNVVRGMLLMEGVIERVVERGLAKRILDPTLAVLAERIIVFRQETGRFEASDFLNALEDEHLASIVAGWMKPRPEEDDLRPEVDGMLTVEESLDRIRLRSLEQRKAEIKDRMKKCIPGEEEYNLLAQELWSIGRRLHH